MMHYFIKSFTLLLLISATCSKETNNQSNYDETDIDNELDSLQADSADNPPVTLQLNLSLEGNTSSQPWSPNLTPQNLEQDCLCDLHPGFCEINCCCDTDCNDEERKLFSSCRYLGQRKRLDKLVHSCHSKGLLYSIRSPYSLIYPTATQLFCVSRDNSGKVDFHRNRVPFASLKEVRKITPRHGFGWTKENKSIPLITSPPRHHLIAGDVLQEVTGKSVGSWQLPFALFSEDGVCDSFRDIQFLQTTSTSCLRYIRSLSEDCVSFLNSNKYNGISIAAVHPSLFHSKDCISSGQCVQTSGASSNETTFITEGKKQTCLNAVRRVKYTVVYNQTEGSIISIGNEIQKFNLGGTKGYVRQYFEVVFTPLNSKPGIEYSGNPGYLFKKPIISFNFNSSDEENRAPLTPLTLPLLSTTSPRCLNGSQVDGKPVEFGVNTRSGCLFGTKESNDCQVVQDQIMNLLKQPDSFTHVSVFGNSNRNQSSEWIPILTPKTEFEPKNMSKTEALDSSGRCPILVTGFSFEIYFGSVGRVDQSQAKILGFVKKYQTQSFVNLIKSSSSDRVSDLIQLSTSVSFFDVTYSSRSKYAPSPVLRLQLPADFFYPFFVNRASQATLSSSATSLMLLMLLILLL